jgi:hypothetical protein
MSDPTSAPVALWQLERLLTDDLPTAERERIRARVAEDVALQGKLRRMQSSSDQILAAYPPRSVAAAVARRSRDGRGRLQLRWLRAASVAAGALAVLLVVALPVQRLLLTSTQFSLADTTRAKRADARLQIYRSAAGAGADRLEPGAVAHAGDQLQIGYVAAGAPFGVILSIDGNAVVTVHLPEDGLTIGAAPALRQGTPATLSFAYELDDAPSFELFVFVTSGAEFDVQTVLAAAREWADEGADGELVLPVVFDQSSFRLAKE